MRQNRPPCDIDRFHMTLKYQLRPHISLFRGLLAASAWLINSEPDWAKIGSRLNANAALPHGRRAQTFDLHILGLEAEKVKLDQYLLNNLCFADVHHVGLWKARRWRLGCLFELLDGGTSM
jgi:hypothetical protein